MKNKKALLIGCGAVAVVAVALLVALVLFLVYLSKDVEGMEISINAPTTVPMGTTFDLEVVVKNTRTGKPLKVSDVDIAEEYLAAFIVTSTTPPHKSSMHVPVDETRSFSFDASLPPGATTNFIFHLRAEKAGLFRGDVDVCEGTRFTTKLAQTVVKPKE